MDKNVRIYHGRLWNFCDRQFQRVFLAKLFTKQTPCPLLSKWIQLQEHDNRLAVAWHFPTLFSSVSDALTPHSNNKLPVLHYVFKDVEFGHQKVFVP